MNSLYQKIWTTTGKRLGYVLLALSLTACNGFLDVRPEGQLPSAKLLKNATGYENALYGVYASIRKDNLYGKTLSHEMIEMLAQYFDCFGNLYVNSLKAYDYKNSTVETTLYNVWKDMYANIANLNNILIELDKLDKSSMRHYELYKGEALGLRAFLHFDLLRLYTEQISINPAASGIPFSTKFELSPSAFAPAQKVYERIITDLKEAEVLLAADRDYLSYPKVNPSEPFLRDRETHFNLYAVQATLARIYLTMGDRGNAALYAEKVIQSNKFGLLDKTELANNSMRGILFPKESIFGLYSTTYFNGVNNLFLLETSFSSYNPRKDIKSKYELEQQGHDYRWEGFFKAPATSAGNLRFVKLVDPYQVNGNEFQRPANAIIGINMIRLPEMYYIAAESLLSTAPQKAADYFDKILLSRGLEPLQSRQPNLPLTMDRINAERYKEFIGEGQTFFNMKRQHMDIQATDNTVIKASKAIYNWPIPNDELEYNPS